MLHSYLLDLASCESGGDNGSNSLPLVVTFEVGQHAVEHFVARYHRLENVKNVSYMRHLYILHKNLSNLLGIKKKSVFLKLDTMSPNQYCQFVELFPKLDHLALQKNVTILNSENLLSEKERRWSLSQECLAEELDRLQRAEICCLRSD